MKKELGNQPNREYYFGKEWFRVEQVSENVLAIREPHHDQDVVSYLVQGENQDMLIDSGMGLANILDVLPQSSKPTTLLLSHTHWDHMGGASDFPDVRVFNNQHETSRLYSGWGPREMPGFDKKYFINIGVPASFSGDTFRIPGVPHFQVLNDGESINIGNDTLHVIGTPGHTPGSTSFYLENAGYLFTGDTLYVGPLYLHMIESNYQQFLSSIEKLASIGKLNAVFPGHNDTLITPQKFQELISLIRGARKPDFENQGADNFNTYNRVGWHMKDMGENRTFSLLMPRS